MKNDKTYRIDGFGQINAFYKWLLDNPGKAKANHISLYFFIFKLANDAKWKPFKCQYFRAKKAARIGNNGTYYKCLSDLESWGLIEYLGEGNTCNTPFINLVSLWERFDIQKNAPNEEVLSNNEQNINYVLSNTEQSLSKSEQNANSNLSNNEQCLSNTEQSLSKSEQNANSNLSNNEQCLSNTEQSLSKSEQVYNNSNSNSKKNNNNNKNFSSDFFIKDSNHKNNNGNDIPDASALPAHKDGFTYADTSALQVKESRVKEIRVKKSKEEIIYTDFVSPSFLSIWGKWISYKKEIGKPYKTLKGMKGKYEELVQLCGNSSGMAEKIVNQSINNEWQGFFPLKETAIVNGDRQNRVEKELKELRDTEKLVKWFIVGKNPSNKSELLFEEKFTPKSRDQEILWIQCVRNVMDVTGLTIVDVQNSVIHARTDPFWKNIVRDLCMIERKMEDGQMLINKLYLDKEGRKNGELMSETYKNNIKAQIERSIISINQN